MPSTQTAKLWLSVETNNSYHHALSIPLEDVQPFTLNPFAWLRYVASTIHGREGHISLTPHGTEIDDEDIEPKEYYYVSQDLALLLDPALMEDRTSVTFTTADSESTNRDDFRQRVTDRDGTCVLTGGAENLVACHIVPHAKTHQYMANLVNHRGKDVVPPLDNINDTRNGILLYTSFHRAFWGSRVAFLRVNSEFRDGGEQMWTALHNLVCTSNPLGTERMTFQHFRTNDRNLALLAPHNCDATIADSDQWPPDLLFDVAYGMACLDKWGTRQFMQFARTQTYDIYYAQGDDNGEDANGGKMQQSSRAERAAKRAAGRVGQASVDAAAWVPGTHDMILGLWMSSAKKAQRRAESAKMDRTKKEVQAWLGSLE